MQNFRDDYKADWQMRMLDFVLHLVAAFVLTRLLMHLQWKWMLWQWFPDVCLLWLWPYSMITKKYVADSNWILRIHQSLHSEIYILGLFASLLCGLFLGYMNVIFAFAVFANSLVHISIDHFTHEKVEA